MNITLDLETIPTIRPDVRDFIAATVTHPGNISKAESIAKWNEEIRPAAVEEAIAKTGLDGAFGRICVIGWAVEDAEPQAVYSATDEARVLRDFAELMGVHVPLSERHTTCIVGHHVSGFDLRFLVQRFIVHGIKPPMVIARAAQAKPWESEKVFDSMVQWAGVGGKISLEKLCLALNVPSPKGEIDGSKVWQFVQDGRIDEVAEYCKKDVVAARAIHQRMTFSTLPVREFEDVSA